jgi:quercetin dioxygenase-like cupin family protein
MIQITQLDLLGFAPGGARLAPIMRASTAQVMMLSLESEQSVDPCRMSLDVFYLVHEGRGTLQVDDERAELTVGSLAFVPKNIVRSIECQEHMRVLAIQVA